MPLVRKMALRTELVWPSKVLMQLKSPMAQSLTVLSPDAVRTHYNRKKKNGVVRVKSIRCFAGNFTDLVNGGELCTPYPSPVTTKGSQETSIRNLP